MRSVGIYTVQFIQNIYPVAVQVVEVTVFVRVTFPRHFDRWCRVAELRNVTDMTD